MRAKLVLPTLPVPTDAYSRKHQDDLALSVALALDILNRAYAVDLGFIDVYDDLRFPASGINPAGAVNAPSFDTSESSFTGTLLFAGAADNLVAGVAQLPHAWARETPISPHIHWAKTTASADTVDWTFYYRILGNPNDSALGWSGPFTGTLTAGDQTKANTHLLTTFPDIDLTGYAESVMLNWKLYRLGNTDAYGANARLYELDFHYKSDKQGTNAIIPDPADRPPITIRPGAGGLTLTGLAPTVVVV